MIPTKLSIAEVAERLAGDAVSVSMVRAPAPGAEPSDRSLVVMRTAGGLIVLPGVSEGGYAERAAEMVRAQAFVKERIA